MFTVAPPREDIFFFFGLAGCGQRGQDIWHSDAGLKADHVASE